MRKSPIMRVVPIGATLAVGIASPIAGQVVPAQPSTIASVERIEVAAMDLEGRGEWGVRAGRLVAFADTLPMGSSTALDALRRAALIELHIGDTSSALKLTLRAADDASATGDVVTAAHASIDAAWIAAGTHRPAQARELVGRALLLSRSPLLGDADRVAIERRVGRGVREVAALR